MRAAARWIWIGLLAPGAALGGAGPWTLEGGEHNVYAGGDYFRYATFVGASGDPSGLSTNITSAGATGVWTFGMAYGLEAEVKLAFEAVRVTSPGAALCRGGGVPEDWCDPTAGVGDLAARVKWRFVDEAYGSPVSIAASAGTRTGEAYANRRARLTTLGDGTTDLGALLSVGRTALLGQGWYAASVDAGYWYRFANRIDRGVKVPADEITLDAESTLSLHPRFGLGPAVSLFTRLGGVALDPTTADYADPDYWSSLRATQVKVGGKLGIYSVDNGPTVSVAVLRTVWAQNNPSDTLALSVGIGQWIVPTDG